MDRKNQIFEKFIQANDIVERIDFTSKQRKYFGIGSQPLTKEELMGSIEFAGFADGYEGHPSKFKFQDQRIGNKQMQKELANVGIEMLPQYKETPQTKYEKQYQLGFIRKSSSF